MVQIFPVPKIYFKAPPQSNQGSNVAFLHLVSYKSQYHTYNPLLSLFLMLKLFQSWAAEPTSLTFDYLCWLLRLLFCKQLFSAVFCFVLEWGLGLDLGQEIWRTNQDCMFWDLQPIEEFLVGLNHRCSWNTNQKKMSLFSSKRRSHRSIPRNHHFHCTRKLADIKEYFLLI